MKNTSFETLILPAEFYENLIVGSLKLIILFCVLMVVVSIVKKKNGWKCSFPFMWYVNVPKIVISVITIFLVFFFDYQTRSIRLTDFEDMYVTTYFVGLMAVIELMSGVATMVNDVIGMMNQDEVG